MNANEKAIEIIAKIKSGDYTPFDEKEDMLTAVAELTISDARQKEDILKAIKLVRGMAEMFGKTSN